jgi:hypothetical protein
MIVKTRGVKKKKEIFFNLVEHDPIGPRGFLVMNSPRLRGLRVKSWCRFTLWSGAMTHLGFVGVCRLR